MLGACSGGITTAVLLSYLAATQRDWVHSCTCWSACSTLLRHR
ncbi:MAG: hypothetical protein R3E89_14890 [Thiolinea sp.]